MEIWVSESFRSPLFQCLLEWCGQIFPITGSCQKLKKLEGSILLQVNVITGHVALFFPQARDIQEFIPLINQIIARFKVSWIC